MILLLDAGNSRIKWGLRQGGTWLLRGACPTGEVSRLQTDLAAYPLRRALLCCVAGDETRAALERLLAGRVEQVSWVRAAAEACGLRNDYQPPESLGADRYAALVAAARRGLGDCVVVTVGTALTVDVLTAEGRFLGGAIAPGPDLMQRALQQGTAGVREFSGELASLPTHTAAAVATGIALAQVGVVTAMRERLARRAGRPVTLLLSGGARAGLRPLLAPPVVEADDLVLEGLAWMAKEYAWED